MLVMRPISVSGFALNSNSLTSSIPSELGKFVQLASRFELCSNRLCGDIPDEVQGISGNVEGWKVKTGNSIGSKGPGTTCVYDPTPLPSALPTPRPTSLPSFVPTVSCADGTYLSESGECEVRGASGPWDGEGERGRTWQKKWGQCGFDHIPCYSPGPRGLIAKSIIYLTPVRFDRIAHSGNIVTTRTVRRGSMHASYAPMDESAS